MRAPTIYWPSQIKAWDVSESKKHSETGKEYWQPARPESGLRTRFIDRVWIAWHVFIGDLDALDWRDRDF